jgi:hypothetical protein
MEKSLGVIKEIVEFLKNQPDLGLFQSTVLSLCNKRGQLVKTSMEIIRLSMEFMDGL